MLPLFKLMRCWNVINDSKSPYQALPTYRQSPKIQKEQQVISSIEIEREIGEISADEICYNQQDSEKISQILGEGQERLTLRMRCETEIIMEFVCLDQRFNRRLVFPRQRVVVITEDGQKIDLKKTLDINEALQYTLSDCVLFTSNDDADVMLGVLEKDRELKIALTPEIKDSQKINLSFLRLKSPTDDDSQCLAGLETFQQPSISPPTLTRKRKSEETPGITEEQNTNQIKKRKKLSTMNSSGSIPEKDNNSDQQQQLAQQPQLQLPNPGSEEEEMSAEKDELEGEKAISKKSQERLIKDALEMVCRWRDLQDFYKTNSITKDYQSVADEIGISKKTLDYYYLELRTAEYFGFDFDQNLKNKMGYLREFVTESKKIHRAKFSTNKIPRNSSLKYRIPGNYQESQTGKTTSSTIEHTVGVTQYTPPFYDPAIQQHQQQQQSQSFLIQQFQQPPQSQQQQLFQQSIQPQHQILQRNVQSSQASTQQAYPEQQFQAHIQHQKQHQQQHFGHHTMQIPQHLQQPHLHRQQQQLQQGASSSSQTLQMMMEPHPGFSPRTLPVNQQTHDQAQTAMPAHSRQPFSQEFYTKPAFPSNEQQQSQYSTAVLTQRFSQFCPYNEPANLASTNSNNIGSEEQICSQQLQQLQLNRVPSQKQQLPLNIQENTNNHNINHTQFS